jgi:flagellin
MSLVINTNINSLNTQNNLAKSQNALSQATQRLSSGLKINSAADNAAGFAISQRYTTQIGGLAQASANASDAINLAQTAGSALDQVTANLQAIRDLAAQSANGTYSASDRATIDAEVQQRLSEVTRIANQTTFNGTKVLDGSFGSKTFQIGANVGQTVSVGISGGVRADQLGAIATSGTGDISAKFASSTSLTLAAGALTIKQGASSAVDLAGTYANAGDLATAITTALGAGNGSATVDSATGQVVISGVATKGAISFGGAAASQYGFGAVADGTTASTSNVAAAFQGSATALNIDGSTNALTINGKSITGSFNTVQSLVDQINATADVGVTAAVNAAGNGFNLYSPANFTASVTGIGGSLGDATATGSLQGQGVTTVDNANKLISSIDVALSSVASLAANLGAVQNRFQSTISTLSAQTTNLQASQSTIQDADFAAETANLSKANVLQQAGISVLAQANANPQQVLKLLQ